ncbi:MAG: DUF4112 domain-containing protein [Balneolaceae bacterium]|nr:DUF4112 domain-containing protein [Balneolaceae bacterium]
MPDPGLQKHQRLADLLDNRFHIPGTNIRFGIDPIIGLIPGAGDWIGAVIALYYPVKAVQLGAKPVVLFWMFLNIAVDLLFGSVPVIGELFDLYWKCNQRNSNLLVEMEQDPDRVVNRSRWLLWALLVAFVMILIEILILFSWLLVETVKLFL